MEVKPKALVESKKKATKAEEEIMKTKKDDVMTGNDHQDKITLIKGHLKIFESLRKSKATKDDQSPKTSRSSSSSAYVMMIKMGNYKNSFQRSENTNKKMANEDKNKKIMNMKQNIEESSNINVHKMKNKKVWDCESTLYDSFELNSFNRQLDSAISSSARSMSMPHLSSPPPLPPSSSTKKQSPNKISRSLHKLIKSMFKHKESNAAFKATQQGVDMDKYYVVFDKTGSLTTIPESGESTAGSETNSLVRKTVSERFPPSRLVGISCS